MNKNNLPHGWGSMEIKQCVDKISPQKGQKIRQRDYLSDGEIPIIDQGQGLIGGYSNDDSKKIDCELPVIIFGDHTRIVKYINFHFCAGADGVKIIKPKPIYNTKFFYYLLVMVSKKIDKGYARHYHHIEKMGVSLPSLPEQSRIVEKIDELFSEIDKGIIEIEKVKNQLKIYRQAVLAAAFEGELTKEWREDKKYNHNIEQIPLEDVCIHITDGDHQPPPKSSSGIPFVMISNIDNNEIDFSDTKYVSNEYFSNINYKRIPTNGDVLYTVVGSFGIPILIDYDKDFCFQRHIALLRPKKDVINQKYLFYVLQSNNIFLQAQEKATGTAQKTVALGVLRKIIIPIVQITEQEKIVSEIESRLSVCDKFEEIVDDAIKKAESLRQSILKKAFFGELVEQEV